MKTLEIDPILIQTLEERSVTEATNVQKAVIPVIASGKHCFFESETGTGKTFAYLLPIIQKYIFAEKTSSEKRPAFSHPKIIIVSPTLELGSQIKNEVNMLSPAKAILCFGGSPIKRQAESLKDKPFAVVGSSIRLAELMHLKKLKTHEVQVLILDEVDRLFTPEMRDDTIDLIRALPKNIQLIACSATLSQSLQKILTDEVQMLESKTAEIIAVPKEDIFTRNISHWAFFAEKRKKFDVLRRFLAAEKPTKAIIFCMKTDEVIFLSEKLRYHKTECVALTARMDKVTRKQALDRFRSGKISLMVAGDLAARGLDFPDISHIIQTDLPSDSNFFIHRAGRTARAGKQGINVIIGDERELNKLSHLEKKLGIIIYPKQLRDGKVLPADTEKEL
ncbi:MAG: DEAD/DEAH box helicase [Spirochaetales bacterium]